MTALASILALLPPLFIGWMILRNIEGYRAVLCSAERLACGLILGQTVSMFTVFLLHTRFGLPLNAKGFFGAFLFLAILTSIPFYKRRLPPKLPNVTLQKSAALTGRQRAILLALGIWTGVKICTALFLLTQTPPYHDDVVNNWNYRAKAFYLQESMDLNLPLINEGINSYPPTVPLLKTWTAVVAGRWDHGAVNAMHIVWYVCALVLMYFALRRFTDVLWSAVGTYALASLPLYLMQSSVAYADVLLSLHVFIALSMMMFALREKNGPKNRKELAMASLAVAALLFVKNEGLALYAPPLMLALLWTIRQTHTGTERLRMSVGCLFVTTAMALPWLLFKWRNGLSFGNAKSLDAYEIGWQEGVLNAVRVNTFFEANWSMLFAILLTLLLLLRKQLRSEPFFLPLAFVCIVAFGQLFLYMFTSLSVEAIQQTGLSRGVLHIVPCVTLLTVLLLRKKVDESQG